jgi:MFS family permease
VDIFASDESFAALGLALFSIGMVVGRLSVDKVVQRLGRLPLIQIGSWISAGSVVVLMFSNNELLSLTAWLVMGLGLSGVVPQIFAMSGEIGEATHTGRNLAKVVGLSYLGALVGPSVIGVLTVWLPLNLALIWGLALSLLVVALAPKLERMDK